MKEQIIKIFILDDDPFFSSLLYERLNLVNNYEVEVYDTAAAMLSNLHKLPNIVIIDYNLPDMNGIDVLKRVKSGSKEIQCIVLSGQNELMVVVEAYKHGAKQYIIKGENAIVECAQNIEVLTESILLRLELENLKDLVIERNKYSNIIGDSGTIKKVFRLMEKVQNIDMPVLITGKNGTGKELVASALHYNSHRNRKPYVAVNVAAIPEDLIESELFGHEKGAFTGANGKRIGKFEEANRGTIFLDEIGEMNVTLQTKLLRVLQERKITRLGGNKEISLDIRVLAATNKNLWSEVEAGRFREDLYFRLQGFLIHLPDLKDRENDIIILAKHFVREFCKKQHLSEKPFSQEVVREMMNYSWPGNVRELKSMVERAILIGDGETIQVDDLVFVNNLRKIA